MTTIGVTDDPSRPIIIHQRGAPFSAIQVPLAQVPCVVASAKEEHRVICVHQLYRFMNQSRPEAICERDDLRFVAI